MAISSNSGNSYVSDNSTLANFQSWSGAIFTAIESLGWTQTSDTGQAANPPASVPSNAYVYRMYKAADSLASSMPIYMKVMVGYSTTSPRIQFVVGTGSDGAGNVTGPAGGPFTWGVTNINSNNGSTTYPCYFSGHAGEFRMYMWRNGAQNGGPSFWWAIERSKSSSGADTADYVTILGGNAANNLSSPYSQATRTAQHTFSATYSFRAQGAVSLHAPTALTMSDNGVVGSLPVFPVIGKLGNPALGVQGACSADVADGATVTVASLYGSTHTYLAMFNNYLTQSTYSTYPGNTPALLLRYE